MKEKIADIEHRFSPRFEVDLPVEALGMKGRLLELSDQGFRLSFPKPISHKDFIISLQFPSSIVQLHIKAKWNTRTGADGGNLYGVEIVGADNASLSVVRKYIVMRQFKSIAKGKDKRLRKYILVFAKRLLNYISNLQSISNNLRNQLVIDEPTQLKLQTQLASLTDDIVKKGEDLRLKINNKILMDRIKQEFRKLVSCWTFRSPVVKRCFDKPKGYPGDYRSLEVIYDMQTFASENDIGYYFDRYFLDNPYAVAVRNRKDIIRETLKQYLANRVEPAKILNLASGSCREIRELVGSQVFQTNKVLFSCLDWDEDAITFSKEQISNLPPNIEMHFIKDDILKFIKSSAFFGERGLYDLVYSIGLADYLPDRVIKKMIRNVFEGLKPGGEFILAFKDKEITFSHLPPEWFCDWVFVPRNESDVIQLIRQLDLTPTRVERDQTGQVFFITLTKK